MAGSMNAGMRQTEAECETARGDAAGDHLLRQQQARTFMETHSTTAGYDVDAGQKRGRRDTTLES